MVPLELSKDNNQYCKISVFMPNAGSINESVISVTNVGGDSFSVAVSMIRWNTNKEYVRNRVLVVIGKPNICCIQNLYNYSGDIYKYRVKWFSNSWGNWQTVSLT